MYRDQERGTFFEESPTNSCTYIARHIYICIFHLLINYNVFVRRNSWGFPLFHSSIYYASFILLFSPSSSFYVYFFAHFLLLSLILIQDPKLQCVPSRAYIFIIYLYIYTHFMSAKISTVTHPIAAHESTQLLHRHNYLFVLNLIIEC